LRRILFVKLRTGLATDFAAVLVRVVGEVNLVVDVVGQLARLLLVLHGPPVRLDYLGLSQRIARPSFLRGLSLVGDIVNGLDLLAVCVVELNYT